jgi:hypothetical protein
MTLGLAAERYAPTNPSHPAATGRYFFDPPISEPEDMANVVLFVRHR